MKCTDIACDKVLISQHTAWLLETQMELYAD